MGSQQMNKRVISSCFYSGFPIIAAVTRCYFVGQSRKKLSKSTRCRIGSVNFPVLTVNTGGVHPRRAQSRVHPLRFTLHPSPFTLPGSRFTLLFTIITGIISPGYRAVMKRLENYRPAVRRHWLIFTAGVVWLTVGIGLTAAACFWLCRSAWPLSLFLGAGSLALGMMVYSFAFSRIVRKNLARIGGKPEMVCLFAFQGRRSYLLILAMMLMGYTIRHLPIPGDIDAVVYFTMGSAMIFGSSLYFRVFAAGVEFRDSGAGKI